MEETTEEVQVSLFDHIKEIDTLFTEKLRELTEESSD